MKNNTLSGRYCFKNPRFKQIFRIMRISTFLLMVCVFCSYAGNAHSQNAKVSIRMNNVKLDKILNEIENQTDYLFIYNNQVDINKITSVSHELLPDLLKVKLLNHSQNICYHPHSHQQPMPLYFPIANHLAFPND